MSLLDVGQLSSAFDLILCTGVLHHLPNPDAGLKALADVLEPSGSMGIMLYGKAARTGVYQSRISCGGLAPVRMPRASGWPVNF